MVAGQRTAPRRAGEGAGPEAGFTLIEVLVAITLVTIVMTALTTFFVGTVSATSRQGSRQVAAQLADDAVERVRSLRGSALAIGRDRASSDSQWASPVAGVAPYLAGAVETWDPDAVPPDGATAPLPTTAAAVTIGGLTYRQNWYLGRCWQPAAGGDCGTAQATGYVEFFRVVVAVTWSERHCPGGTCSFVTSTLVSSASGEPVFNPNLNAHAATVHNPGNQFAVVSAPVSLLVTAAGGAPPLTWSATGLPAGLSMNASGLVSGTPTTAGTYSVVLSVTDGFGLVGTAGLTWKVLPPLVIGQPGSLAGEVTAAIAPRQVVATGGITPYTWSASGLPPGLSIDTTGKIVGTPTTAGSYPNVKVTVTDAGGHAASTTPVTWTVIAGPDVSAPTTAVRTDTVGTAISLPSAASGGTGPYTWTAADLPAGLTITTAGLISGTLTAGTRYVTTVTATDSVGGTDSVTVVWNVTTATALRVTAPTGDLSDLVGQSGTVTASSAGGSGNLTWSASGLPPGMAISTGGSITGTLTQTGSYPVTLTVRGGGKVATFMFVWTVS